MHFVIVCVVALIVFSVFVHLWSHNMGATFFGFHFLPSLYVKIYGLNNRLMLVVIYAVNFAAELLCLRDQSYILTNDVLNKDDLNDLLSVVLCK